MLRHKFQFEAMRGLSLLIFLSLATSFAAAQKKSTAETIEFRGGLRNSNGAYRLEPKHLATLLASLRAKTGFTGLHFDDADYLVIGHQGNFVNGSGTARKLLSEAVEGKVLFRLESHNHSPQIKFAQLKTGAINQNMATKAIVDVSAIIIDFPDFDYLTGDREALRAFDLGFIVLHELVHGVYHLPDATENPRELGKCDEVVNKIRRDLGLPERQYYLARSHTSVTSYGSITKSALQFTQIKKNGGNLQTKTFYLFWETGKVGRVTNDEQLLSAVKVKNVKAAASLR